MREGPRRAGAGRRVGVDPAGARPQLAGPARPQAPLNDLAHRTWPEAGSGSLLVVPLGSTEQHGPHLPLGTDTLIAVALARGLAAARSDVVVAPALPYGSSGEHAGFAGTLSIGGPATTTVLVELVRSADAYRGVVLVCGHGGNAGAVRDAVAVLEGEGRRVLPWFPSVPAGDAHAGRTETSLLLAIAPELVHVDEAAAGSTAPLAEILPRLQADGVASVSPNGVLGDPAGASAAEGQALLEALTSQLVAVVDRFSSASGADLHR